MAGAVLIAAVWAYLWGVASCQHIPFQNSYRAAVLEYAPHSDSATFKDNWQRNLREYVEYIRDAANQRSQIIVFPEYGLSGLNPGYSDIEVSSTEIPDPVLHVSPCTAYYDNNYSTTLRELSCAAKNHKIHVVVNLIEKALDPAKTNKIYYNANVVFNTNGEIIARYRKMNLNKEPYYTAGNELSTFNTDFGVVFGNLISTDLLAKVPSQEILQKHNVTDVVLSSAWFSHLPFSQSLGEQHGYAKSNGVNLLAAGLSNPKEANGGSGVYYADGRVAETFVSGTKRSKLIIQDVPKISARVPNNSCRFQKSSGSYKWGVDPHAGNISGFSTHKEDLQGYTFKSINLLGLRKVSETVCSGTSSFCCTFNISISRTNNVPPNYVYKLAAFQGTKAAPNGGTLGLRNCGIVACTNDADASCGERNAVAPRGVRFEEIAIGATLDGKEARYQPYTVTYDLKPATDYTFCEEKIGNDGVEVAMGTTDSIDSLLAFGVTGRVFGYDNLPAGLINFSCSTSRISAFLVFLAVALTFI